MKKSIALTLLLVSGLVVLSVASCGGSNDRQVAEANQPTEIVIAKADMEVEVVADAFKKFPIYTDGRSPDNHYIPAGYMGDSSLMEYKVVQDTLHTTWSSGFVELDEFGIPRLWSKADLKRYLGK